MAATLNVEQNLELETANFVEVGTVFGSFGLIVGTLVGAGLAGAVIVGGTVAALTYKLFSK